MILCKKEEWATFLSKDYSRQPVRRESQHPVLIEFVITPPPFFFSAVSRGVNFTLARDVMIIAPMGDFVNQPVVYVGGLVEMLCEKILSVLFGTAGAKKNIFASQIKTARKYFAPAGATKGAALGARDLFEKRSIKNFHEWGARRIKKD